MISFFAASISIKTSPFGWDIHKTWLDETIGTFLAVLVLVYFGNDPASIIASVVFAVLPEVLSRRREKGTEDNRVRLEPGVPELS